MELNRFNAKFTGQEMIDKLQKENKYLKETLVEEKVKTQEKLENQDQFLKVVKDITSKGFLRSDYKRKLVDLTDIRINLKGKK